MSQQYYGGQPQTNPQNLQFYPSTYSPGTPSQASGYGYAPPAGPSSYGGFGGAAVPGVSGRMGEAGGLRTGWLAAFSTEGYEHEPPLLEELGVNFGHIQAKTLAVLNPFRPIDVHIMEDSDLAGPLVFILLFGTFLLFSGRVPFGYIYGLAFMGSSALHIILDLMTPAPTAASDAAAPGYAGAGGYHNEPDDGKGHLGSKLTFTRSASVLGYCLLPLVITSLVGIGVPLDGAMGYSLTSLAICWSTLSSSKMFCALGRMRSMRGLVAYPLALFYIGFGIISIFSSRGSGALGKAAGVA